MRFKRLAALAATFPKSESLFLLGAPGLGKSALAREIHRLSGGGVLSRWELTGHGPEDLVGVPFLQDGMTVFAPPERLKQLTGDVSGTLVLEDITQASRAVQVACFQLVQERSIGAFELSPNVRIILTGNRSTDKAGARELPSALRNRVTVLDLEPSVKEWVEWAATQEGIHPAVPAFLLTFEHHFSYTPDKACKETGQFPSPRSWETTGRLLTALEAEQAPKGEIVEVLGGTIGNGVALEFVSFFTTTAKLPPVEEILADPKAALGAPPKEISTMLAIATSISTHVGRRCKDANKRNVALATKYLKALHFACARGHKEGWMAGLTIYQACGGSIAAISCAAQQNAKSSPEILDIIKYLAEVAA